MAQPQDSIAPGLHAGADDGVKVVVWDPCLLELGAAPLGGVRQQELLQETPRSAEWIDAHAAWNARREALLRTAAQPSFLARTVTALAAERAALPGLATAAQAITIERSSGARAGRPHGARFGSLVHAILAYVALDAERAQVEPIARAQARLIAATEDELDAGVTAVLAALAHPLLRRAAAALEVRRETPIAHDRADGVLAEGIVDLAFRERDGWVIVDFKTDVELGETNRVRYAEQLRFYVDAVHAATGEPARGVLLEV